MGFFNRKLADGGIMDVIRCDEPSYLIWKWHPEGVRLGDNQRENTIRWGSSLRVKDGSVAIFVYRRPDGAKQDYIEGPYDKILETANLPVLSGLLGLAYDGNTPFQAEIYFINLAQIIQIKFGIPYFDVFDPRFPDYGVPVAVRGTISFKITNYLEFISLHRLDNFSMEDFRRQIKDAITRYVKNVVANAPEDNNIPVVQLERKIAQINDLIEKDIKARLFMDFGVTVSGVDISAIEINKASEGYRQFKAVTQDLTTAAMQAQNEVNIKEMRDAQKLSVFERTGRMVVDIKEDQYARRKTTQSQNMAAYQTEAAEHVGVAGARGLGKMGSKGGLLSGGFNAVNMMAGMAVGSAVGQNIANAVNKVMGVQNNPEEQQQNKASSSSPAASRPASTSYHVVENGKATGPFDTETLKQMVISEQVTPDTLVWTSGMTKWMHAKEVDGLKELFEMPPIPDESSDLPPIPTE